MKREEYLAAEGRLKTYLFGDRNPYYAEGAQPWLQHTHLNLDIKTTMAYVTYLEGLVGQMRNTLANGKY